MTTAVNTAPIKWAQRSDSLYLTIALADVKDETIKIEDSTLVFKGKSEDKDYEVNIEFLKKVDAEGSTYKVLPRSVQMHIIKDSEDQDEFWPRLLKDKALEKNQVKIDWDRYVDEDEEDEAGGFDTSALEGGMGMGGMGGMPGMGGLGGMGGMGGAGMEDLMKQMGSMGGGPGGMGGFGAGGDDDDEDDDDDDDDDGDNDGNDDLPELEESS